MANLEFLTVEYNEESLHKLEDLFARFKQATRHTVTPIYHNWDTVWRDLLNVGIYRRGADLAEIGTTWLNSLISMNALHQLDPREIKLTGEISAFLPAAWQNVTAGGVEVYGIPFRLDVRIIHFWRDCLEEAGVDPQTAFQTPAAFHKTMLALQKVMPKPFAATGDRGDHNTIYDSASWVWANGGDFISPDGKSVLFDQPAALEGFRQYFELYRFISGPGMHTSDVLNSFIQRKVAAITLGPWLYSNLKEQNRIDLISQLGLASPPGPAFVGGSVLSVWQHSRYTRESLELIKFLTSPAIQAELVPLTGMLPAAKEAWDMPALKDNAIFNAFYEPLLHGRAFTRVPVWGMIEEKLIIEMSFIWDEIFATPDPDVDAIIKKHLISLGRRLNITLNT